MSKNSRPPLCFLCSKNFEDSLDFLNYCICDISVCSDCINSVKKNESTWICPNCKAENSFKESKLIRS